MKSRKVTVHSLFAWTLAATLAGAALFQIASCGPPGDGNANDNGAVIERAFLGALICLACHSDEHATWSETAHADALESLKAIGQDTNEVCLACHTVGFGGGGFVDEATTPELAGVQCENCHGAAEGHPENPTDEELQPNVNLASTLCGECHTDAHHPTFDEWQLSDHAEALSTLLSSSHAADHCLECHSQDYRHAIEHQEEGEDVEVPAIETAQLSVECSTCHAPHGGVEQEGQLREPIASLCGECHTQGEDKLPGDTPHHPQLEMVAGIGAFDAAGEDLTIKGPHTVLLTIGQEGQACAQCHVVRHEVEEPNEGNPNVTGHTFNPFDLEIEEHQADQYTGCLNCHTEEEADAFRTDIQAEISGQLEALAPFFDSENASYIDPETLSEEDQSKLNTAKFNYQFISADGSNGVHNAGYTEALLDVAENLIGELTGAGPATASYVGSTTCGACHPDKLATFQNTGHPFKLNKIEDDTIPTYPDFTPGIAGALEMIDDDDTDADDPKEGTDNTLGTPEDYGDISYVIGGYGWKSRWIDKDGYIVTGSAVQYNLETQAMAGYHDNETDKPYNCGNCHTTGWKHFDETLNPNRQDDLPGMDGTFAFPGVQCESCHGAGSIHVASQSRADITEVATARSTADFLADDMAYGLPVACSECHTRHGEKDYPTYVGGSGLIQASGGLIKHHEQYDEKLGINPDDEDAGPTGPHAYLACNICHDPHTTTKYMDVSGDPPGMKTGCTSCHTDKAISDTSGMKDLACIDCHMPLLAKSAIKHDAVGTGPATGDIRTHIFRIDLSQENQFTEDGSFSYPWITGEFACKTCHDDVTAFNLDFPSTVSIHGG